MSKIKILFVVGMAAFVGLAAATIWPTPPDANRWDIMINQGKQTWYTDTFDNKGNCLEFFDHKHRHVLVCGDYNAAGRTEPKPEVKASQT